MRPRLPRRTAGPRRSLRRGRWCDIADAMRQRLTVRRLAVNLIVLVASLAFSLAAVEFAGRLFGVWRPDRSFRYHPVRGYELRPGIGDVNTLGLAAPSST